MGVGNPGPLYEGTRHNLGSAAVREAVRRLGLRLARPFGSIWKVGRSRWVRGEGPAGAFLALEPLTFVNRTGIAVAAAAAWCRLGREAFFVVCDDLTLPLGRIRLRARGSHGGHKGLRSIEAALGSDGFPRLRMGIGLPEGRDAADHVLSRFGPEEEPLVASMIDRSAEAIRAYLQGGSLEELTNRLNR